ncbi:MAG: adenylate/guanylate cyclase domain-containing protein [Pseudomonadota bacterium]
MDQPEKSQIEARRQQLEPTDFAVNGAELALQTRLAAVILAAPAVLLFGEHWPAALNAYVAFFLGMSAVLDLAHLAFVHTRVNPVPRSVFFSIAHVCLIAFAMLVIGGVADDHFGLDSLVWGPAPLLFFAGVAFSLPIGPAVLPLITAVSGGVAWVGLAFVAQLTQAPLDTGSMSLVDRFWDLANPIWGSCLLLICGFVAWRAMARARSEAEDVGVQRRRLDLLSHYVPPDLAWQLNSMEGVFDQVTEFECAILLVDISHFQRKMEVASIIESGKLIQEFHELVGEVVFKNGGVLRHMEGDSLYAVFGLLPSERCCVAQAVLCAQTMAEAAKLWRSERIERGRTPADIYMGIDFGRCVIVPNAHPDRPDFSIIGSPFSAARRMERVARLVAADLAITGHAVHQLEEEGAGELSLMLDHRGPQKVDDRRGVVEVRTWSLPLSNASPVENVA